MAGVFLRDCDHDFPDWILVEDLGDSFKIYDRSLNLLMTLDCTNYNFVIYKAFNKLPRDRCKELYYRAKKLLIEKGD